MIAKLLRKVLYVGAFAYIINNFNWLAGIVFRRSPAWPDGHRLGHHDGELLDPAGWRRRASTLGRADSEQNRRPCGFSRSVREPRPHRGAVPGLAGGDPLLLRAGGAAFHHVDRVQADHARRLRAGAVRALEQDLFLAEKVLGNVVSSGVKVLVLAVIVGIGSGLFAEFQTVPDEPSIDHALVVMLASRLRCWRWASSGRASPRVCPVRRSAARHGVLPSVPPRPAWAVPSWRAHAWPRPPPSWPAVAHAPPRRRPAAPSPHSRLVPLLRAAGPRARWLASAMSPRPAQAAGRRAPVRCRAEGGRFLPGWLERHRCRRGAPVPARPPQAKVQTAPPAQARATRLGQADAPPPADHPCRDHRRPHAARWRRRRLRARPEPA